MNPPSRFTVTAICLLLFGISFVSPIAAEFSKAAEYKYYPDDVRMIAAMLSGTVSGLATILAFLNNSFARFQDNKKPEVKP